jgi:Tfp pilus assembly protein PilO
MPTWLWIVIAVVVVLLVLALAFLAVRKGREKRVEKKRGEAHELRLEAEDRLAQAGRREAVAEQEAERARRERAAAQDAIVRAEDVDPDVPDSGADESTRGGGRGARRLRDR